MSASSSRTTRRASRRTITAGSYLWAFNFVRDQALTFPCFMRDTEHRLAVPVPPAAILHRATLDVLKALDTYAKPYIAAFEYPRQRAYAGHRGPCAAAATRHRIAGANSGRRDQLAASLLRQRQLRAVAAGDAAKAAAIAAVSWRRPHEQRRQFHTVRPATASGMARRSTRLSLGTCLGFGVGTGRRLGHAECRHRLFPGLHVHGARPVDGARRPAADDLQALRRGCRCHHRPLSDRTRSRWGRRRPFLLHGAVVSAASFLMIFTPTQMSQISGLLAYMTAAWSLLDRLFAVQRALYGDAFGNVAIASTERTRLLSFRTVFVSIGQLLSLAGTAALIKAGGGGVAGYRDHGSRHGPDDFRRDVCVISGHGERTRHPANAAPHRFPGRQNTAAVSQSPVCMLVTAPRSSSSCLRQCGDDRAAFHA